MVVLIDACGSDPCPAGSACRVDAGVDLGVTPDASEDGTCRDGVPCVLAATPCRIGAVQCGATPGCVDTGRSAPAGTVCGPAGERCDGAGGCGTCVPGVVCDTGNPCATGRVDCGSGGGVCIAVDDAPPGTSCGEGGVCGGASTCSVCIEGAVCDTGNPCTTGRLECSGGGAGVCVPTADLAPGTACGVGLACGAAGCTTCVAGAPCVVPGSCREGVTACEGGVPSCVPGGVATGGAVCRASVDPCDVTERCDGSGLTCPADLRAPAGTPCPGGLCDETGACVPSCVVDGSCGPGADGGVDAGFDAGVDAGVDARIDAGLDAGFEAGADAGFDAGVSIPRMSVAYSSVGGGFAVNAGYRVRLSLGAPQPAGAMRSSGYLLSLGGTAAGR